MENKEDVWRLGDLKALRGEDGIPQKKVETMVVAGSQQDCYLFQHLIKKLNPSIKVIPVTHSDELLGLLNFFIPDLLLLNLQMPCQKGMECLRQIREMSVYDDLPIAAFSSLNRSSNRTVAQELGANYYFRKTEDESLLEGILKDLLNTHWSSPKHEDRSRTA